MLTPQQINQLEKELRKARQLVWDDDKQEKIIIEIKKQLEPYWKARNDEFAHRIIEERLNGMG